MLIGCGCCHGRHATVAEVRRCCEEHAGTVARQAKTFAAEGASTSAVPPLEPDDLAALVGIDLAGAVERAIEAMAAGGHGEVLRQRLGVGGRPPATLARVGKDLGVTKERVRQLENKALPRLKRAMCAIPDGARTLDALAVVLRPRSSGYGDRVIAATALLCPDWPARPGRKIVMSLAGKKNASALDDKRSLRLVHDQTEGVVARIDQAIGSPASDGSFADATHEAARASGEAIHGDDPGSLY